MTNLMLKYLAVLGVLVGVLGTARADGVIQSQNVSVRMNDGEVLRFIARPIFGADEDFGGRYPSVFTENCETDCAAIDAAKRARDEMVSSRSMSGGVSPYELICKKLKGHEAWGKQLPETDGLAESFCFFKDSRNPKRNSYINTAELWRAALKNSGHFP